MKREGPERGRGGGGGRRGDLGRGAEIENADGEIKGLLAFARIPLVGLVIFSQPPIRAGQPLFRFSSCFHYLASWLAGDSLQRGRP
jgi:hypothetical protein